MNDDFQDEVRRQAITSIDLTMKTIPFIVMKSLDRSNKVRLEVYKVLKNNTKIAFSELDIADRIHLI